MGIITRALLLLAPRRRVRLAFTRHFERRDWDELNLGSPLSVIREAKSVEDSRYTDKSLALWPLR